MTKGQGIGDRKPLRARVVPAVGALWRTGHRRGHLVHRQEGGRGAPESIRPGKPV